MIVQTIEKTHPIFGSKAARQNGGKLPLSHTTDASMAACRQNDFGGTAANDDHFRGGLPDCQHGGMPELRQRHGGGEMARKIGGNSGTPDTKLGHRVAPAATSVVAFMAEVRQISESQLIEGLIRLGFDHLPVSQREAISVLLRAKGQSIRDLRPLHGLSDASEMAGPDGEGEGRPPTVRINGMTNRIGEIARKAHGPIDAALDGIAES